MQRLRATGNLNDVSDREYFQEAIKGNEFITNIQVGKSTGERIVTFSAPVKDKNGEIIGIVQRNYNLKDFHQLPWCKEAKTGWVVASCRVSKVALKSADMTVLVMSIIGGIFLVVFGIAAFFISRLFTAPIGEIHSSLAALADGRFSTITKYTKRGGI